MKTYVGVFALASTMLWSVAAVAMPAPKSEAEMMTLSDLVVDAEAMTIVCDGAPKVTTQKTETYYLSTFWPSKSYKGSNPKSFQIRGKTVVWTPGPGPIGGWFQGPVPKGWVGKLYLQKETDGTYTKVWWNAMIEDTTKSKPETLPVCLVTDGGVPDAVTVDGAVSHDAGVDGPVLVDGAVSKDFFVPKDMPHPSDEYSIPTADKGAMGQDSASAPTSDDGGCAVAGGDIQRDAPVGIVLMLLGLAVLRRRRV
ncbi:MAG: hypothetical protein KAI47_20000 [Deltaproteobacteria bacterium]|nr:hypothetical protein [Deltaproteobacteria bacterium]